MVIFRECKSSLEAHTNDPLMLRIQYERVPIHGHITFADWDFYEVEIDNPFSNLRAGEVLYNPETPSEYWFVTENEITDECRRSAKFELIELYRQSYFFEKHLRQMRRILDESIERGSEYYNFITTHGKSPIELAILEEEKKAVPNNGFSRAETERTLEEERDFDIISAFYKNKVIERIPGSYLTWAKLIEKHFGMKLRLYNELEERRAKRLKENEGKGLESFLRRKETI